MITEETRKKLSEAGKRRVWSQETREKIRLSKLGKKFPKMSLALRGRKLSEETKKKLSDYLKAHPITYWKGKKMSPEHVRKVQEAKRKNPTRYWLGKKRPDMTGDKNPNWKGGASLTKEYAAFLERHRNYLKKSSSGKHTFAQWEELKKFCEYTCLCCGKKEPEIKLSEDHIVPLSMGGTNSIDNIQPLCLTCNTKKGKKNISYLAKY